MIILFFNLLIKIRADLDEEINFHTTSIDNLKFSNYKIMSKCKDIVKITYTSFWNLISVNKIISVKKNFLLLIRGMIQISD